MEQQQNQETQTELTKSEKNKIYQKEYYTKNKDKLLNYGCKKVECLLCGRQVIRNNILSHQKKPICIRNREGTTKLYKDV